jgi:Xaa-Pro aminopeptidase
MDAAAGFLNELGAKRIGFEENAVTYAQHRKLRRRLESNTRLVSAGTVVDTMRLVKDEDEISRICRAVEISDRCFSDLLNRLKPGLAERDVALEIEICLRRNGAEKAAFESIVAAGPNSAHPHHRAGGRQTTFRPPRQARLRRGVQAISIRHHPNRGSGEIYR